MRVHILANELGVNSKVILEKCRAEGLGDVVKNHMSTLSAGLEATIREWFSEGAIHNAVETAEQIDLTKVRVRRRRRKAEGEAGEGDSAVAVETEEPPSAEPESLSTTLIIPAEPVVEVTPVRIEAPGAADFPEAKPAPIAPAPPLEPAAKATPAADAKPAMPSAKRDGVVEADSDTARPKPPAQPAPAEEPGAGQLAAKAPEEAPKPAAPAAPAGPKHVPAPAKITGPRVVRYEAPEPDRFQPRSRPAPGPREGVSPPTDLNRAGVRGGARKKTKAEEAARIKAQNLRRTTQTDSSINEKLQEWRDQDLAERKERLRGATGRKIHRRRGEDEGRSVQGGPKMTARLHEPVTVRDFCAATGINQIQVAKTLIQKLEILANINTALLPETAQLLGLEFGIEVEVVPAKTALDLLEEEFADRPRASLAPRPPVVTIMGHVDHGKTSLLDRIRKARVAAVEDGGITQHIGSYHYEKGDVQVTFLDTPGHAAFTAMRERGANLTDIVVLVVAADDGVMPQTVEALNHAKAAKVPIMVALNKIDLGRDNLLRIYGQLAERELSPVAWGGETEVVETSATTGEGIDKLLETIMTLSELMDLKADPTVPATGVIIEAETKPGVGAVVRVLVQEGTLAVGDILLAASASGKVRALVDDLGQKLKSVGPGMPVEVWGLDGVPQAGDKFYRLDSAARAKEIADDVRQQRVHESRGMIRKARSLAEIFARRDAEEVPELNVIIRADVQGSIDALVHLLSELPTDKVKLSIRHTGVGAVTESDVLLASATDAVIIGFRVEPTLGAKRLIDEKGVDVRTHRIIYEVSEEITRAMEGLLAPEEHYESRATLEVRNLFRISKVGLVAGCYVTGGTIARNHVIKLVRDGVVVRENCPMASLRHFKDDVKEVRAGKECGVMLEGFSDVHVGDLLESFELVRVAQTLK
ncbi:MAG: translation initiation factor IF-2 [Phycisphaerales bacterium]|nr:translation initiation factor IF-2 [Phycisphaerales bacterium]